MSRAKWHQGMSEKEIDKHCDQPAACEECAAGWIDKDHKILDKPTKLHHTHRVLPAVDSVSLAPDAKPVHQRRHFIPGYAAELMVATYLH